MTTGAICEKGEAMTPSRTVSCRIRHIGIAVVLGLMSSAAIAQQPTQQQQAGAIRQFCRSDYAANCAGVPTGGEAALQCLRSHVSSLSPECQNAVNAAGPPPAPTAAAPAAPGASGALPPPEMSRAQEVRLMRRSCSGDFRTYCQGVELGGGRALQCLKANESKLSPTCKSALADLPKAE